MKTETLIQHALEEWSAEARVPTGLADRALRRRTGRRVATAALVVGSAALLAGAGVVVDTQVRSAGHPATRPSPMDTSLHADPSDSPPRRFVAAGSVALSAYYVGHMTMVNGAPHEFTRKWSLYDPASGGYRRVPWAFLDVAPGLRRAAVLEGPLPTTRVGILDMRTQRVTRWIPLSRGAAGVSWSPDGRRLLVTTYAKNPDVDGLTGSSSRTGFIVVDVKSGESRFYTLGPNRDDPNGRQDLGWSRSGKLIWAPSMQVPLKVFYDLNGAQRTAPPHEADEQEDAGLSPNGRNLAVPGPSPGPSTIVKDVSTGRSVGMQPVEQLRAWADDTHLIALACLPHKCGGKGEFHNRFVLVSLDGKTMTPLTGYQNSNGAGAWEPLFTHR